MKVSNSVFLLLACASVVPSMYASAPASSSTSSPLIATSDEIELVAADAIAQFFIEDRKERLEKAYDANMEATRDTLMQKRALYAKAIAKKHSSEELTWKNLGVSVILEIKARVEQEDRRLKKEFDCYEMDMNQDLLDDLLFPVKQTLDHDIDAYEEFIKEHPTTTIREYLESDACKVQ